VLPCHRYHRYCSNRALTRSSTLATTQTAAQSDWDGEWTDNWGYGKSQMLCADNERGVISGVWSKAGVFYGKLSGADKLTATGSWYEAGTGPCYSGTFEWTLNKATNTITGSAKCIDGTGGMLQQYYYSVAVLQKRC
jgi:hypothetical protein